jgi:hypothetical protein
MAWMVAFSSSASSDKVSESAADRLMGPASVQKISFVWHHWKWQSRSRVGAHDLLLGDDSQFQA